MPVFRSEKLPNKVTIVIFHLQESEAELWDQTHLWPEGEQEWAQIHHPQKKLEWLGGRIAVQHLCQKLDLAYHGVHKDEHGKPHLREVPGHITISHCWPYAAAAYHPHLPLGLDLEEPRDKLVRLAPKFLDDQELNHANNHLDYLALQWSAKESLYKLHGRKQLAFREQLKTSLFDLETKGTWPAIIWEDDSPMDCHIYYEKISPTHWLTIATPSA